MLPPSELEKPWITLPWVGHCHAIFDATGATTFALTGVLFVVSTCVVVVAGVLGVLFVKTGCEGSPLPTPDLIGPITVPSEPICVPFAPGV